MAITSTSPLIQTAGNTGKLRLQFFDAVLQRLDHSGLLTFAFLVSPVDEPRNTAANDAEESAERGKPLEIHTFNRPSGASGNLGDHQVTQLPRVVVERLVITCLLVDDQFDVVARP